MKLLLENLNPDLYLLYPISTHTYRVIIKPRVRGFQAHFNSCALSNIIKCPHTFSYSKSLSHIFKMNRQFKKNNHSIGKPVPMRSISNQNIKYIG